MVQNIILLGFLISNFNFLWALADQIEQLGDKVKEAKLKRFGHVQKDSEYNGRRMLEM